MEPPRPDGDSKLASVEQWRLDYETGGPGAVHVSEFAEIRAASPSGCELGREAYGRPTNRRDLGHRCQHCRRPFSALGLDIVTEIQGPAQRFHAECWKRFCAAYQETAGAAPLARGQRPHSSGSRREPSSDAPRVLSSVGASLVSSYADEWRACATSSARRPINQARVSRAPVMDGLVTMDDSRGDRKVSSGLSPQELALATARWAARPGAAAAAEACECAICLSCHPEGPVRLPCGHVFCGACVEPWLRRCALCPTCRRDLRPPLAALRGGGSHEANTGRFLSARCPSPAAAGLGTRHASHPAPLAPAAAPHLAPGAAVDAASEATSEPTGTMRRSRADLRSCPRPRPAQRAQTQGHLLANSTGWRS